MPLTLEMLQKAAPAVFADKPASYASPDYQFFPTHTLISALMEKGWEVASAQQRKASRRDPTVAKHMVTLQHPSWDFSKPELGNIRPRISAINSHDWSSKLALFAGFFRFICGNGMVIASGAFEAIKLRHDVPLQVSVDEITSRFDAFGSELGNTASRWNEIQISNEFAREYALRAGRIRWGDDADIKVDNMLTIRREEDANPTLWNLYNRMQEHLTKGGYNFVGNRSARALTNIDTFREVNTNLWALTEEYAKVVA